MVEFAVRVPEEMQPVDAVFLAGDGDAFGGWRADGLRLDRWGDGSYRTRLDLPLGAHCRYLVTRGSWRGVENEGEGRERLERELRVDGPLSIDLSVAGWGRDSIRYHHDFHSHHLVHNRSVTVYLPPHYYREPSRRYPVLYMHDGQNLFDAETAFAGNPWNCDEVAERVIRAGECESLIIVGVGNTPDRLREYGPRLHETDDDLAQRYGRLLVEEVKPFIDAAYRTRRGPESTGVGGSSMGGLISLHLCEWYPEVFGKCAAMSPSVWWDRENFARNVPANPRWLERTRVWLDMGGLEGATSAGMRSNLRRTRRLALQFRHLGLKNGEHFRYLEVPNGRHNERDWSWRFDQVLRFLFPVPKVE